MYGYVRNNAVIKHDPLGLAPCPGIGAPYITPTCQQPNWTPSIGVEGHLFIGGGASLVWCCQGKKAYIYWVFKLCYGLALGVSAGAGLNALNGHSCSSLGGWGIEFAGAAFGKGEIDISMSGDDPDNPAAGGGLGVGGEFKASRCHYWAIQA